MGNKYNSIINNKINQIAQYYFFHKKIDYIINSEFNPLINHSKSTIIDKIINPNEIKMEQSYYIIDKSWIEYWKIYSNYEKAKLHFDTLEIIDKNQLQSEVKEMCNNMVLMGEINSSCDAHPGPMNNQTAGKNFYRKVYFDIKNLDYLINGKTFSYFTDLSGQYWSPRSTNTMEIKGIIRDRIICLIFEKHLKIKFIYFNNEIIQITADFSPKENFTHEDRKKFQNNLSDFVVNKIRKKKYENWIEFFLKYEINKLPEVPVCDKNGDVICILINDKLFLKNKSNGYFNNINFLNSNMERFIGLSNVGATCYMNATLQCFINNNMLTNYLLIESNYKKIVKQSNICELTSSYCELLMNVCCNTEIKKFYKPQKFKDIISLKNPLFKGIQANDSKDLISFMLEEMNNELNQ